MYCSHNKNKVRTIVDNFESIIRGKLPNKFVSLEDLLFSKSNKLLYEINNQIVVIPLTSKFHRNTIPLGSVVVDEVVRKIELELDKINEEISSSEFSKEKIIKDETLIKKISKIKNLINYYKNCSEMPYALLD